jgi:hypothetical protein
MNKKSKKYRHPVIAEGEAQDILRFCAAAMPPAE